MPRSFETLFLFIFRSRSRKLMFVAWKIILVRVLLLNCVFSIVTLHKKMKFSIKAFFSKCDQIRRKQLIWSHLLKKSLIFCAVSSFTLTAVFENGENLSCLFSFCSIFFFFFVFFYVNEKQKTCFFKHFSRYLPIHKENRIYYFKQY